MQLLPNDIRAQLPPLYATESEEDPVVWCKFFTPWAHWTYYAIEFDGTDTFFGLVVGDDSELGYFRLSELEQIEGPFGVTIERDRYFTPTRLSIIRKEFVERR
ncbi:MAG TPA: DUF2958 domain-containing protein [Roseiflexaceae bacterium]|nr:DUF2958 domain-containing protein [Roseiflexaceae bacterium]HMP40202.1 DUF2958 domain-containing protein [Roseiflexaceae bacterium]